MPTSDDKVRAEETEEVSEEEKELAEDIAQAEDELADAEEDAKESEDEAPVGEKDEEPSEEPTDSEPVKEVDPNEGKGDETPQPEAEPEIVPTISHKGVPFPLEGEEHEVFCNRYMNHPNVLRKIKPGDRRAAAEAVWKAHKNND